MNYAKIICSFFLACFTLASLAQGPGGVSGDLVFWLRADADIFSDAGITPATTTGTTIEQWNDQAGLNNVAQTDNVRKPFLRTSPFGDFGNEDVFNGYPSLAFQDFGTSDFMETSATNLIGDDGDYTKVVVHSLFINAGPNNLISAGTGADFLTTHGFYYGGDANVNIYHGGDVTGAEVLVMTPTNVATMASARFEPITDNFLISRNGGAVTTTNTATFLDNSSTIQIGAFIGSSGLNGQIAEAILFNNDISDADLQKVWSYLAIKYGITLDATDALSGIVEGDYVASDDQVVWDFTANSAYHNDVAGIARDNGISGSNFLQLSSKSNPTASDDILTITASSLSTDLTYFIWGNDDGSITSTTTTGAEIGRERVERIWKAQESGTGGDAGGLTLEFDISTIPNVVVSAGEITLLVDNTDTDFSDATVTTATSFVDDVVTFTGVNIGDGDFFTLGFPAPLGPGGITANLRMWLKADAQVFADDGITAAVNNDPVQRWNDRSVESFDVTAVGTEPIYQTEAVNFNPALDFAGTPSQFMVTSQNSLIGSDNPYTKIIVHRYDVIGANNLFSGGSHAMWYSNTTALSATHNPPTNFTSGGTTEAGQYYIGSIRYDGPGGEADYVRIDGTEENTTDTDESFTDTGTIQVGAFGGGSRLDGQIAEVIVFDAAITDVQAQLIDSYLGIKYGITNTNDYIASDGITTVWSIGGGYDNGIAGIGRDDATGLSQIKSKSENSASILTIDKGTTFSADLDFLVWGHDGGSTDIITTGAEIGRHRLTRIWNAQETGNGGDLVDISFDLSALVRLPNRNLLEASDFTLLIENAGDGDFSDVSPISADSYTDLVVTFSDININTDDLFTLGISSPTGPGGVVNNLGVWLRSDVGVFNTFFSDDDNTPASDGNLVFRWLDQSPLVNDFIDATVGTDVDRPTYQDDDASSLNFYPVLDFDGGDLLDSFNPSLIGDDNDYTKIVVHTLDNIGTDPNNLFSSSTAGGRHAMWYSDLTPGLTPQNRLGAIHLPGTNILNYDQAQSSAVPYIGIVRYDPSVNNKVVVNGDEGPTNTTVDPFTDTGLFSQLGAYAGGNNLIGNMSEVILFTEGLSDTDITRVQSYLALKYGITLTDGTNDLDYVASDGSTLMWDASVSSTYEQDIFGFGKDKAGGLVQAKSKSSNADGIVTIANGSISSPETIFSDLTFLTIGNDGAAVAEAGSSVVSGINDRLSREWKVYTNGTFTLEMQFDLSALALTRTVDDFALIVDRDGNGDFSDGVIDTYLADEFMADIVTISGVILETGDVFTLGTARSLVVAPGGVSTDLDVWLKADVGVTGVAPITAWLDQSGNNNDAAVTDNPTLVSGFNSNNMIDFDGTLDELTVSTYDLNPDVNDPKQIFVVYQLDNTSSEYGFIGNEAGTFNTYLSSRGIAGDGAAFSGHQVDAEVSGVPQILSVVLDDPTLNGSEAFVNGESQGTFTYANANGGATSFNIGSVGNGNLLDGKIAELIIYSDATQTGSQRNQVETYLAIKYGITLDQTTPQNYVASDGLTDIWNASLNTSFNNQIVGIGRDDASGLNQLNSVNDGDILTLSSPAFDQDISFVVVGNNGGSIDGDEGGDVPVGVDARLQRTWLGQQTETINGTISFDLSSIPGNRSETDLVLLLDDDGTFASGTNSLYTAGRSYDGNIVSFSIPDFSSTFSSTRYFTVATIDNSNSPLPVELVAFNAELIESGIMLRWRTLSETNNSHFELETSYNSESWVSLARVNGQGDSNDPVDYTYLDRSSYTNDLYYRLKQVDFDGKFEYSDIIYVTLIDSQLELIINPNPVQNILYIKSSSNIENIDISTISGNKVFSSDVNNFYFELDTSNFSEGVYLVKLTFENGRKSITTRIIKN